MTVRREDGASARVRTTGLLDVPGGEAVLVAADLVYKSADCLAATMVLRGPDGVDVGWTFAWELLSGGLVAPAGQGDIRIAPVHGTAPTIEVVLSTSFGATIRLPAKDVGYFVSKVRALAPLDDAHVRRALDAELAAIMEEA